MNIFKGLNTQPEPVPPSEEFKLIMEILDKAESLDPLKCYATDYQHVIKIYIDIDFEPGYSDESKCRYLALLSDYHVVVKAEWIVLSTPLKDMSIYEVGKIQSRMRRIHERLISAEKAEVIRKEAEERVVRINKIRELL